MKARIKGQKFFSLHLKFLSSSSIQSFKPSSVQTFNLFSIKRDKLYIFWSYLSLENKCCFVGLPLKAECVYFVCQKTPNSHQHTRPCLVRLGTITFPQPILQVHLSFHQALIFFAFLHFILHIVIFFFVCNIKDAHFLALNTHLHIIFPLLSIKIIHLSICIISPSPFTFLEAQVSKTLWKVQVFATNISYNQIVTLALRNSIET